MMSTMRNTRRNAREALHWCHRSVNRGIGRVMRAMTTLPSPSHVRPSRLLVVGGLLVTGLLAGCGGSSSTAPSTGSGGGGGGAAPGGAAPGSAAVTLGDIFFKSARNGSSNAAVDTVVAGGTVTWTWAAGESLPHSVQSLGSPSFASSAIQSGGGKTYQVTFPSVGTYQYDCAVHGQMMTGRIVVQAAASSTPAPGGPTYP
jgi:Copper binding proteins, plastocyanin/azurin family